MAKSFQIPEFYRSPVIGALKVARRDQDPRKKDFTPSIVERPGVRFKIARHFGFCYGVENAIEIAYRAISENPGKRVFLLSEMIHNPHVNQDLVSRGITFLQTTSGEQLVPFETLTAEDIVIVPAFGTTVELFARLAAIGIDPLKYNATCPFVEKVWKRSEQLGTQGYTVVIHGKETHEETRATFSHAKVTAPSVVIRSMDEAERLAQFVSGTRPLAEFWSVFSGRTSPGFEPERDLQRIGVVNQTTMLATETLAISDLLKAAVVARDGDGAVGVKFADTRDTLCYATWDNQEAVKGLIASGGDLAVVVGGYNSSNTSHLVELCEEHYATYYVKDSRELLSAQQIRHLMWRTHDVVVTDNWLPATPSPLTVLVTAGASCPDSMVEAVVERLAFLVAERQGLSAPAQ